MTTAEHPAPVVRAVVNVLADEMERASDAALAAIARDILDTVETARTRPVIDRLGDVVDQVTGILDQYAVLPDAAHDAASAITYALFGDPYAIRHDDGTAALHWPDDRARAALVSRDLLELLVADANRVRAGSEPYPREDGAVVELTTGQWWATLLDLTPDARAKSLEQIRAAVRDGSACWMFQHAERVDSAEARVRELEAEVDTLRRTLDAVRGPLAPLVTRAPVDEPAP